MTAVFFVDTGVYKADGHRRRVAWRVVDVMRRETPLQWVPVLEAAGFHSARRFGEELGVAPQTALRLLHGEPTSRDTIEAAATLLGVSVEKIRELRGERALPPFRLPPEADHLTQRQRVAVVAVVRAMLEGHPPEDELRTEAELVESAKAAAVRVVSRRKRNEEPERR